MSEPLSVQQMMVRQFMRGMHMPRKVKKAKLEHNGSAMLSSVHCDEVNNTMDLPAYQSAHFDSKDHLDESGSGNSTGNSSFLSGPRHTSPTNEVDDEIVPLVLQALQAASKVEHADPAVLLQLVNLLISASGRNDSKNVLDGVSMEVIEALLNSSQQEETKGTAFSYPERTFNKVPNQHQGVVGVKRVRKNAPKRPDGQGAYLKSIIKESEYDLQYQHDDNMYVEGVNFPSRRPVNFRKQMNESKKPELQEGSLCVCSDFDDIDGVYCGMDSNNTNGCGVDGTMARSGPNKKISVKDFLSFHYDGEPLPMHSSSALAFGSSSESDCDERTRKRKKERRVNITAPDALWHPHFHPHNQEFRVRYRYKGSMRLKTLSCSRFGREGAKRLTAAFVARWQKTGRRVEDRTVRSKLALVDLPDDAEQLPVYGKRRPGASNTGTRGSRGASKANVVEHRRSPLHLPEFRSADGRSFASERSFMQAHVGEAVSLVKQGMAVASLCGAVDLKSFGISENYDTSTTAACALLGSGCSSQSATSTRASLERHQVVAQKTEQQSDSGRVVSNKLARLSGTMAKLEASLAGRTSPPVLREADDDINGEEFYGDGGLVIPDGSNRSNQFFFERNNATVTPTMSGASPRESPKNQISKPGCGDCQDEHKAFKGQSRVFFDGKGVDLDSKRAVVHASKEMPSPLPDVQMAELLSLVSEGALQIPSVNDVNQEAQGNLERLLRLLRATAGAVSSDQLPSDDELLDLFRQACEGAGLIRNGDGSVHTQTEERKEPLEGSIAC